MLVWEERTESLSMMIGFEVNLTLIDYFHLTKSSLEFVSARGPLL